MVGYVFIVKKKGTTEKSIQYNATTYIVHCGALISKVDKKKVN